MEKAQITKGVLNIIQNEYPDLYELYIEGESEESIFNMSISENMGLDSLEMLYIKVVVEREFRIKLTQAITLSTLGELVEYIHNNLPS